MPPPLRPLPPRVVADSNVIVSALHVGGNPEAVLTLARRGTIALYVSPFILTEVATVLERPKFSWPRQAILDALRGLPGEVIDPGPPRLHILADDADNRIIECAVAARAGYVVTGDRELLALGKHGRIRIVSPREFLVGGWAP